LIILHPILPLTAKLHQHSGNVVSAPQSIMPKLWHCDTTQWRDIVTQFTYCIY